MDPPPHFFQRLHLGRPARSDSGSAPGLKLRVAAQLVDHLRFHQQCHGGLDLSVRPHGLRVGHVYGGLDPVGHGLGSAVVLPHISPATAAAFLRSSYTRVLNVLADRILARPEVPGCGCE